jgi:hypothetical protein
MKQRCQLRAGNDLANQDAVLGDGEETVALSRIAARMCQAVGDIINRELADFWVFEIEQPTAVQHDAMIGGDALLKHAFSPRSPRPCGLNHRATAYHEF